MQQDKIPVFTLDKVSCSYPQQKEDQVLSIHSLELRYGEITFLLGASGSGKSTLLETLGMMNQTIDSGEVLFHATHPQNGNQELSDYRLRELWEKKCIGRYCYPAKAAF